MRNPNDNTIVKLQAGNKVLRSRVKELEEKVEIMFSTLLKMGGYDCPNELSVISKMSNDAFWYNEEKKEANND